MACHNQEGAQTNHTALCVHMTNQKCEEQYECVRYVINAHLLYIKSPVDFSKSINLCGVI